LPTELGQPTPCSDGPICWHWGSAAKFFIDQTSGDQSLFFGHIFFIAIFNDTTFSIKFSFIQLID